MENNFDMPFEEAQDYISKRGLDVLWNDGDIFIDKEELTRSIGNALKYADETLFDKISDWIGQNIDRYISCGIDNSCRFDYSIFINDLKNNILK